jgi:hypothetical protein
MSTVAWIMAIGFTVAGAYWTFWPESHKGNRVSEYPRQTWRIVRRDK